MPAVLPTVPRGLLASARQSGSPVPPSRDWYGEVLGLYLQRPLVQATRRHDLGRGALRIQRLDFKQMRCEATPQRMRMDVLVLQASTLYAPLTGRAEHLGGYTTTAAYLYCRGKASR